MPILMLPAGAFLEQAFRQRWLWRRSLATLIVALGVAVQIAGVAINSGAYNNSNYAPTQAHIMYDVRYSPVVGHWQRLLNTVKYWWEYATDPSPALVLQEGFEMAAGASRGQYLPTWMEGQGKIRIFADATGPLDVEVYYGDYRPAGSPPEDPRALLNGQRLAGVDVKAATSAHGQFEFQVPALGPGQRAVDLLLQVNPWFQEQGEPGATYVQERGIIVERITVNGRELTLQRARVPAPPIWPPRALFGWFYNPRIWHLDFWWWYWYFSGLPRDVLWSLLPLAGLAVWSGLRLSSALRRPANWTSDAERAAPTATRPAGAVAQAVLASDTGAKSVGSGGT